MIIGKSNKGEQVTILHVATVSAKFTAPDNKALLIIGPPQHNNRVIEFWGEGEKRKVKCHRHAIEMLATRIKQ